MKNMRTHQQQQGFTLIEIAIVMVIIGLLLGGVLKGQEMIKNARAHNVSNQRNGVQAAILGFQDRYRALPGDYLQAQAIANIPGVTLGGNGNSRVGDNAATGTGEAALVWTHLASSGFISGSYDGTGANLTLATWDCPQTTCLQNAFSGGLVYIYSNQQVSGVRLSNQLWSGRSIPADTLSEVDRKLDDGVANTGSMQLSKAFSATGSAVTAGTAQCNDADNYDILGQPLDCGAVFLF